MHIHLDILATLLCSLNIDDFLTYHIISADLTFLAVLFAFDNHRRRKFKVCRKAHPDKCMWQALECFLLMMPEALAVAF